MTVEFGCPGCGRRVEGEPGASVTCARCGTETALPAAEGLSACLACGGDELYRHRDFNQKLGFALIGLGAGLWILLGSFWPMVAAAALDLALYLTLPDVAICYQCRAHHRGFADIPALKKFDLERHEHHRFRKARAEGRLAPREEKNDA